MEPNTQEIVMIEKREIYICEKCKNLVESLWDGKPDIVCCGQPMTKLVANDTDAATEKHVPVVEKDGNKVTVKVGSAPHPMTPEHYILFIEVLTANKVYRHDFKDGDTVAEATFVIDEPIVAVREFCNLHGLWQTK
jgi:superoxide reductase